MIVVVGSGGGGVEDPAGVTNSENNYQSCSVVPSYLEMAK